MITTVEPSPVRRFSFDSINNTNRIFIAIITLAIVAGIGSGYVLSSGNKTQVAKSPDSTTPVTAKTASSDNRTFRDFAEGTIQKRPAPQNGEYLEGTHMLIRDGAMPVALTSSVVDLSEYENKKVKVLGETQKAIKEGWLMDVGKVEAQ